MTEAEEKWKTSSSKPTTRKQIMTTSKTKRMRLIELVKGKTLLREAPTRRDVILHIYGIDIDDPANIPVQRWWVNRKFGALLRNIREAEKDALKKQGKDLYTLHDNNQYQYYMVKDESTGIWHCIHIIHSINGDYLLKYAKAQEKSIDTAIRLTEKLKENLSRSKEERDALEKQETKEMWKPSLVKEYCTPKQIRLQVAELRRDKKLPQSKKDYRPHIKGIQHVFAENASEVKYTVYMYHKDDWHRGGFSRENALKAKNSKTYLNPDEIIAGMVKEVILCDYHKRDYQLPEPKKPDYLGIMK